MNEFLSNNEFHIGFNQTFSSAGIGSDLGLAAGWRTVPVRDGTQKYLAVGAEAGWATANDSLLSGNYWSTWLGVGPSLDTPLDNFENAENLYLRLSVFARAKAIHFGPDFNPYRGAFTTWQFGVAPRFEIGSAINDDSSKRSALFFHVTTPFSRVVNGYGASIIRLVPEAGAGISFNF